MKKVMFLLMTAFSIMTINAKTLVVYYSFTNNIHTIVTNLNTQIQTDLLRIEPQEKGLDYAANNYAIGSALISAIRQNPDNASSYPEIDPVNVNLQEYDMIIVAAPLWWSNMAAPLQTFLFNYGSQMAGKKICMISSSASSGISGVVADAKRLIPNGDFIEPSLWIRSSQVSNSPTLISNWLENINYNDISTDINDIYSNSGINIITTSGKIEILGDFEAVSLYNISGYKVIDTKETIIDTEFLISGIYIAHIYNDNNTIIKKLYIEN